MEASGPSLGVRATGLVKQLFLSKRLKRLSTFEPFVSPTFCRFQVSRRGGYSLFFLSSL